MIGVAEFGETMYFKARGNHDVAKADSSFTKGMWFGRNSASSEHLIAISRSIIMPSTSKRVLLSEKWNRAVFGTFNGYQWNQNETVLLILHSSAHS